MNNKASIEIIGLSTEYTAKDIKREIKANGLGRVDSIQFVLTKKSLQRAYVWFRSTKNSFVIAKREELEKKISENIHGLSHIRVCCAKTPRIFHPLIEKSGQGDNEDIYWCVRKSQMIEAQSPNKYTKQITELENIIVKLEDI